MKNQQQIVSFNAIRGLAALAVCASHLRAFVFVNFPLVQRATLGERLFYFMTGLGHESVVVFFVMSGWLVGGSVWQQQLDFKFSWQKYLVARLTRLWVVLIPALVWTMAMDTIGIRISHGLGYDGRYSSVLMSGPGPTVPVSLSIGTFLGNCLFLQTIAVPVLGTNGPLWSLANEFWYYAIFPFFASAWRQRRLLRSAALCVVGSGLLIVMPAPIRLAFIVWLFGVLGSRVAGKLARSAGRILAIVSAIGVLCVLVIDKTRPALASDVALGIVMTGLLVGLRSSSRDGGGQSIFNVMSSRLAESSYTLYLFHFPLLCLVFFSMHWAQQQPGTRSFGMFFIILLSVLIVTYGLWYVFERNTESVRRIVGRILSPERVGAVG